MGSEFFRGVFGLILIPGLAWLISVDRTKLMWKTVLIGLSMQLFLGAIVMLTQPGQYLFSLMNDVIVGLLEFSNEGARFLFGKLVEKEFALANFAFSVLPTIIFFSSLMAVVYYSGVMQKIIEFIAWVMQELLGTSGAETLSVSSNIFVGQTEAPLVVKPFVSKMTKSELMTVMTGGFATVAGGVMAAYVGMLKGKFPGIAGHLLTASIMSAPAAIVMSKLAYPETGEPVTSGNVEIQVEEKNENVIDAAASGAKTGVILARNVGAMLLAFISLVGLGNFLVSWIAEKFHQVVAGPGGFDAIAKGMVFGGVVTFLAVARAFWRGERTKYWFGGFTVVGITTSFGLLVSKSGIIPATGRISELIGAVIGFVIGWIVLLLWEPDRYQDWMLSVGCFLVGSGIFGVLAWLVGGTNSHPVAAGLFTGFLALILCSFIYWNSPSFESLGIVLLITVFVGSTSGLLVETADLNFLNVLEDLTLELLLGYLFSGFAFLMGVPWGDLVQFGQLIGHKIVVNEFVAFMQFESMVGKLDPRSMVIASYALCGFANFSSIAIQIGGIGGIAPERESDLAALGPRAMICGALASFQTAAVAGVMFEIAKVSGIDLVTLGGSL